MEPLERLKQNYLLYPGERSGASQRGGVPRRRGPTREIVKKIAQQ
jgi:hypothetical protein